MQVCRGASVQVCRCIGEDGTGVQVCRGARQLKNEQLFRCASMQMCQRRYACAQVCRGAGVQVCRRVGVQGCMCAGEEGTGVQVCKTGEE